jgi:hypothetical protein
MVIRLEILEKMRAYLSGQLSLDSFRQWIVRAHLEMQAEKAKNEPIDQDAARLLSEIEGRYAELSDEIVSEDLWRKRLAALIAPTPKSAESYLLTFYYTVPSAAFHLNSPNVSGASQETRNPLYSTSNYCEVPA